MIPRTETTAFLFAPLNAPAFMIYQSKCDQPTTYSGLNLTGRSFFQHCAAIGWHCCVIRRIARAICCDWPRTCPLICACLKVSEAAMNFPASLPRVEK